MCGRYTLVSNLNDITAHYQLEQSSGVLDAALDWKPRYNICPGQLLPVIINEAGNRALKFMHWGLKSSKGFQKTIQYQMINVRSETVYEKPAFSRLMKAQRCLVPADSFYEWPETLKVKERIPYRVRVRGMGNQLFSFAGIYDQNSFAILTVDAVDTISHIHQRMPVMLLKGDEDSWLSEALGGRPDFLRMVLQNSRPVLESVLEAYPVSKLVNAPENNIPECVEPANLTLERPLQVLKKPEQTRFGF